MIKFLKQFGVKPSSDDISAYEQSENWKNGQFQNLEETSLTVSFWEIPEILYKQMTNRKSREPQSPIPVPAFDKFRFLSSDNETKIIWYGHSAVLMNMNRKIIFIDPMLGPNAAPIAPTAAKRFSENTLKLIDDFPEIDLILISHDHYDHLDYDSIQQLIPKTKQFFVAMGVKRHLVKWGIDQRIIKEFDWWSEHHLDDIKITFTPTRHFSGRGLTDRSKSLWGGWVLNAVKEKLWFSGDGGYGKHFKKIGRRLGPFDFAFMECGQYNEKWRDLHMFPEDCVQAAIDAGVKKAMPVHWGAFTLAMHTWMEPVSDFIKHAKQQNLDMTLPGIGQVFTTEEDLSNNKWWEEM